MLKADDSKPIRVIVEPLADEFSIPAGESVTLTFMGEPPPNAPHAIVEPHEWGVLVWAEVGMTALMATAQDGTVLMETGPELVRLLGVADQVTFGHPAPPAGKKPRLAPRSQRVSDAPTVNRWLDSAARCRSRGRGIA